jgi:hypothetical protein
MTDARRLLLIRLFHTLAWAVFAGAIIAIPFVLPANRRLAIGLSLLVWVEVGVLALNRLRCPLTDIAARYTDNRADNFDIFLPLWLARWNKWIFGLLFAAGQLLVLLSADGTAS